IHWKKGKVRSSDLEVAWDISDGTDAAPRRPFLTGSRWVPMWLPPVDSLPKRPNIPPGFAACSLGCIQWFRPRNWLLLRFLRLEEEVGVVLLAGIAGKALILRCGKPDDSSLVAAA